MDNSYDLAIQRLKLIESLANRVAERFSDANAQGWLGEIRDAAKEVREYVEAKKELLDPQPPPDLYKSGGHPRL